MSDYPRVQQDANELHERHEAQRRGEPTRNEIAQHYAKALEVIDQLRRERDDARALQTSREPQAEAREAEQRGKRDGIPRHTIEQQTGTIYFKLINDPEGAWVTFANHNAIVTKLEKRIELLAGPPVPPAEKEEPK